LLERIGPEGWKTSKGEVQAKWVIGADGRNSTVARLAGLSRRLKREASVRVGWMANFAEWTTSELRLGAFTKGCYGLAPRVDGGTHACVVLPPEERPERWVRELFGVQETAEWQNLSPLTRAPFGPGGEGVLLAGDAHRVLEPFTGEGIWHALQSGQAVARALLDDTENPGPGYCAALREIYGRHLWVNDLSRWTLESPARASVVFPLLKRFPALAPWLGKAVLH
jgi:flavin-dependent dehydrogenase